MTYMQTLPWPKFPEPLSVPATRELGVEELRILYVNDVIDLEEFEARVASVVETELTDL